MVTFWIINPCKNAYGPSHPKFKNAQQFIGHIVIDFFRSGVLPDSGNRHNGEVDIGEKPDAQPAHADNAEDYQHENHNGGCYRSAYAKFWK